MIKATFLDTETGSTATAEIAAEHAPALRSAIEEIRNELGERVSGAFAFKKEQALTDAVVAVGRLAAAANAVIPEGDPDYE